MEFLVASFVLSFVLTILFKDDPHPIVSYGRLFGAKFAAEYDSWHEKSEYMNCNFIDYIRIVWANSNKYNRFIKFILKLITCPPCVGTFLSIPISFFYYSLAFFPAIAFLGMFFYYLLTLIIKSIKW